MRHPARTITLVALTGAALGLGAGLSPASPSADGRGGGSGGAPILGGGLAATGGPHRVPPAPNRRDHGRWLRGVSITEYWPAPEAWFVGRLVSAPGLSGPHRIDWLYSAGGVSMQGEGLGLDGRTYHLQAPGAGGWVTQAGEMTDPADGWQAGAPYWRAGGYWLGRRGAVTFPLGAGGWSAGRGHHYLPLRGVSFAAGAALPLRFYQSLAVDPRVIPLGSRVYVPAYRGDGHGGWFIAADTGGAINGRHVDVYRSPPASASDPGQLFTDQRIYVIKAHH